MFLRLTRFVIFCFTPPPSSALSAFTIYSLTLVISCSPVPASILLRMLHVRGHHARTTPLRDSHSERACDARSSHTSHVATRFTLGPPRTSEGFLPLHHACIILCMKKSGASIMPPCSPTRRYCCRRRGPLHCPRRRPLHRPLPCEAHSRSVFAGLRRRDSHDSQ